MSQNELNQVPLHQSFYEEKCHSYDEVLVDRNCDEVLLDNKAPDVGQLTTNESNFSMQCDETPRACDAQNQTYDDDISLACRSGPANQDDPYNGHMANQRKNQIAYNNNFWKANVDENSDGENNNTDLEADEDNPAICYCSTGATSECVCLVQPDDTRSKNSFCYQDQFQDDDPLMLHSESFKLPIDSENRF